MTESEYVTQQECQKNIHIPKWGFVLFITSFLALMGLFLTLVGMSAAEASAAAKSSQQATIKMQESVDQTSKVTNSLDKHMGVSAEKEKAVVLALNLLREELITQREANNTEHQIILKQLLAIERDYHE